MMTHRDPWSVILSTVVLAVVFLAVISSGCATNNTSPAPSATTSQEMAAFIGEANNCQDAKLTVTTAVGTFSYQSTSHCALLKTLVKVNSSESPETKKLIEGKSMVCSYTKGNFDSRWVTTLIGGVENCHGDLRDGLAQLIMFT